MTQRRSVHSPGSPAKTPQPTKGANPDGRTPVELPSDPQTTKAGGVAPVKRTPK